MSILSQFRVNISIIQNMSLQKLRIFAKICQYDRVLFDQADSLISQRLLLQSIAFCSFFTFEGKTRDDHDMILKNGMVDLKPNNLRVVN